eukprot:GHVS01047976.1.p1 GENE.GHVS01047976.1~~GHVS01047976.1.p1  ORF type:complete len:355 (+),score=62.70 GHVS01047976.1:84-1148(+)
MAQVPWQVVKSEPCLFDQASRILECTINSLQSHQQLQRQYSTSLAQLQSIQTNFNHYKHFYSDKASESSIDEGTPSSSSARPAKRVKTEPNAIQLPPPPPARHNNHFCLSSCFDRVVVRGLVQLHPCYLDTALIGCRAYLHRFLLSYLPELSGVWVASGRLRLLDDGKGCTADASEWGFLIFRVVVELLVLRPAVGGYMVAKITQVRPSHVGGVCFGLFNACVQWHWLKQRGFKLVGNGRYERPSPTGDGTEQPETPKRKKRKNKQGEEQEGTTSEQQQHQGLDFGINTIEVGKWMVFEVSKHHYSSTGNLLSIHGSLSNKWATGFLEAMDPKQTSTTTRTTAVTTESPRIGRR